MSPTITTATTPKLTARGVVAAMTAVDQTTTSPTTRRTRRTASPSLLSAFSSTLLQHPGQASPHCRSSFHQLFFPLATTRIWAHTGVSMPGKNPCLLISSRSIARLSLTDLASSRAVVCASPVSAWPVWASRGLHTSS